MEEKTKVKATENLAKDTETKPEKKQPRPKTIETMSSEELALELNKQYQMLMQSKDNITIINQQLEKRKQKQQVKDS